MDYQGFDNYCDAGILFLSRLKSNAKIEVLKSKTVIIDGHEVKDSTVLLGDKKQDKQMDNILRILEIPDRENPGSTVRLITNNFEHSAALISRYYREHWQIELLYSTEFNSVIRKKNKYIMVKCGYRIFLSTPLSLFLKNG